MFKNEHIGLIKEKVLKLFEYNLSGIEKVVGLLSWEKQLGQWVECWCNNHIWKIMVVFHFNYMETIITWNCNKNPWATPSLNLRTGLISFSQPVRME